MLRCTLARPASNGPPVLQYQVASTYYGHVYLVELLKDKLKASAPSRLVWTVSAAESLGYIDWDDLA